MPPPNSAPLPRPSRTPRKKKRAPRQDSTLLGLIERAFLRLPDAYPRLKVDGVAVGCGLPAELVTPDEARTKLTDDAGGYDEKDRGWRYLVDRARTGGPRTRAGIWLTAADWQIVALGTALPGLKRRIREKEIVRDEDIDAEIVCQFLAHLRRFDPVRRNVCGRLINTAVQRYLRQTKSSDQPTDPADLDLADTAPGPGDFWPGHPIHVLIRLNAEGHIGRDDARLIAYTRLGPLTIKQAATRLALSESAATMRRARAEGKIIEVLTREMGDQSDADPASAPAVTPPQPAGTAQPPPPRASGARRAAPPARRH